MKTIIAGSRNISDMFCTNGINPCEVGCKCVDRAYEYTIRVIKACPWHITEIVSGRAKGVDQFGEWYARANKITLSIFPANWQQYGNAAGPIRNKEMAEYADACIVIWNGKSAGSTNMIKLAKEQSLGLMIQIPNEMGMDDFWINGMNLEGE